MDRVGVESPLRGMPGRRVPKWLQPLAERILRERNRHYAFHCMHAELCAGRAPYASHLLFDQPGLLDDAKKHERNRGIEAGRQWYRVAQISAFYLDRGESLGMTIGQLDRRVDGGWIETLHVPGYRPLALWRCAIAAGLRWLLSRAYGRTR